MNLSILPLAITMMAGPQIMLSILLVTMKDAVRLSFYYVLAIFTATTIGVITSTLLFSILGTAVDFGSNDGRLGEIIQTTLVVALIILSIKSYLDRDKQKTPKWLQSVSEMDEKRAFKTGLLLIFLMPTDIMVLLTVGLNLETTGSSVWSAFPFILLTTLIAALPLLGFLLFRKKAEVFMPKVRDWMFKNSWLVNIAVYLLFIYILLA